MAGGSTISQLTFTPLGDSVEEEPAVTGHTSFGAVPSNRPTVSQLEFTRRIAEPTPTPDEPETSRRPTREEAMESVLSGEDEQTSLIERLLGRVFGQESQNDLTSGRLELQAAIGSLPEAVNEGVFEATAASQYRRHSRDKLRKSLQDEQAVPNPYDIMAAVSFTDSGEPIASRDAIGASESPAGVDALAQRAGGPRRDPLIAAAQEDLNLLQEDATAFSDRPERLRELAAIVSGPQGRMLHLRPQEGRTLMDMGHGRKEAGIPAAGELSSLENPVDTEFFDRFSLKPSGRPQFDPTGLAAGFSIWAENKQAELGIERDESMNRPFSEIWETDGVSGVARRAQLDFFRGAPNYAFQIALAHAFVGMGGPLAAGAGIGGPSAAMDYSEVKRNQHEISQTVQRMMADGASEQEVTEHLAGMGIQMPDRDVALQQAMLNMGPITLINTIPWLGLGSKYMPANWRGAAGTMLIHGSNEAVIEGAIDPMVRVFTERIIDAGDAESDADRMALFGELGAAVTEGINAAPGAFLLGMMGGATSPAQLRLQKTARHLRDAERSFREGRQAESDEIIQGLVRDGNLSPEQAHMYRSVFETPLTTDDIVDRASVPSTDDMPDPVVDPNLRVTTPDDRAQREARIQDDIIHEAEERVSERQARSYKTEVGEVQRLDPMTAAFRPDAMQFKRSDANRDRGLNKRDILDGEWNDLMAGNQIWWEPTDRQAYGLEEGQQYIVANGHHRLDFAQRTETSAVNTIVLREADGYSEADARRIGAEVNIAEGRGDRYDQVRFLREVEAQQGRVAAERMLGRIGRGGQEAAAIAMDSSETLHNAFLNEQVSPTQAAKIAMAVPIDRRDGGALDATEAAQRAALTYVARQGKTKVTGDEASQFARSALHDITIGRMPDSAALQNDLFGQSPEWQAFEAVTSAKSAIVSEMVGEMKSRLSLIRRAIDLMMPTLRGRRGMPNPQAAKRILKDAGIQIDVQDMDGLLRDGKRLAEEIELWDIWNTDPARAAIVETMLRERHPDLIQDDAAPVTPDDPIATHAALTDMITNEASRWVQDSRDAGQPVTSESFEAYFGRKYPEVKANNPQEFLSALDASWAALNIESVQTGRDDLSSQQEATQDPVAAPETPVADEGPPPSRQMAQEFDDSARQAAQSSVDNAKAAIERGKSIQEYLNEQIKAAVTDALNDPLSNSGRAVIDTEQVISDAAISAIRDYTQAMRDLQTPVPENFANQVEMGLTSAIGNQLVVTRQALADSIAAQARADNALAEIRTRQGIPAQEVETAETAAAEAAVRTEVTRRVADEADRVAPERGPLDQYDGMSRTQLERVVEEMGGTTRRSDTEADLINRIREAEADARPAPKDQRDRQLRVLRKQLDDARHMRDAAQAELDMELSDDPGSETALGLPGEIAEHQDAIDTLTDRIAALESGDATPEPAARPRRRSADETTAAPTARAAQMALQGGPLTLDQLGETLDTDQSIVEHAVDRLVQQGDATVEDGLVSLTEAGEANAVAVADETANSNEATLAGQLDGMGLQQLAQLAEQQGMSDAEIADAVMPHQRNLDLTTEERDARSERSLRDALRQRLADRALLPQSGEALLEVNDPKTLEARTERPPVQDTSWAGLTPDDGTLSNRQDNIVNYATNQLFWTRAPADQQTTKKAVKMIGPKNEVYWIGQTGQVRAGRTFEDSKPVARTTQHQFDAHSIIDGEHTERASRVAAALIEQSGGKVPNGVRVVDRPGVDRNGWHLFDLETRRTRKIMINAAQMVYQTPSGQITVRQDAIRATLAHEYGHAAYKRTKATNPGLFAQINGLFDGLSEAQQEAVRSQVQDLYSDRPTEVQREEMVVAVMEMVATANPSAMNPDAKKSLFSRVKNTLRKALAEIIGVGITTDMKAVTRAAMAEALAELQGVETRDTVSDADGAVVESIESGKGETESGLDRLSLSQDGIDGSEIHFSEVPFGNDAFQYALGRVEKSGEDAVFRRRSSERGTFGGWRWEAHASKVQSSRLEVDEMRSRGGIPLTATFNTMLKPWMDRYRAHQAQFAETGIRDLHADVSRADPDVKGIRAIPHHVWNQFAKRFYEKWLRNTGDLPAYMFDQRRIRDSRLVNTMLEVMSTNNDLEQAMKAEYGSRLQKHHLQLVNTALGNSDPDLMVAAEQALPESVRVRVKRMRDQVDSLSIRMIQLGIAQGRMRATFEEHLGSYIHRSFQVFTEPGYVRRLIRYRDTEGTEYHRIWNRAMDWAQNHARDENGHTYAINPDDPQSVIDAKVAAAENILMHRLEGFMEDGRLMGWLKKYAGFQTDKSVMKKREDDKTLPKPLRELYGEVTDPFLNYSRTIQKMSQVIFNEQMLRNVAKHGTASSGNRDASIGQPFFIDPNPMIDNPSDLLRTHRKPIEDPRMGPLNGLRTTPEIYEALQGLYDDKFFGLFDRKNWLVSVIARAQGITKLNLTVMNASTHPRNYMGAAQFALMQGHLWSLGNPGKSASDLVRSHKLAWREALSKGDEETMQTLSKLRELGVIGQNVILRDYQDMMRVGRGVDEPADIMQSFNTASIYMSAIADWAKSETRKQTGIDFEAVKRRLNPSDRKLVDMLPESFRSKVEDYAKQATPKNITNAAIQLYGFEDNVWKIFGFFNEQGRVQRMHPEWGQDRVNEEAARIIRMTFQNYGELSKAVQGIRRFGMTGTFIAFEAEVARTTFNTLKLATMEMASGNPDAIKIGASRLMGLAATAGIHYMMYSAAKFLGYAVLGPIGRALGYFEEDEEGDFTLDDQNARRRFQPEFWRNSPQATWFKDDEGNQLWTDLGFIAINGTYMRPVQAFLNGEDWIPAMQDAWWASVAPVTNRDPFMSEFAQLFGDMMETDRQHWQELDPAAKFFENTGNVIGTLAQRALVPGTINQFGDRLGEGLEARQDAIRDEESVARAVTPTVARALTNLAGFDVRPFNVESDAVRWGMSRQYTTSRRAAASSFASFANSRDGEFSTPEQAVQVYEASAATVLQARTRAYEDYLRILDMGFPERKALQIMKDSGISEDDRRMIRTGRILAWLPSDEQLSKLPSESRATIRARRRELNRAYAHEYGPNPAP